MRLNKIRIAARQSDLARLQAYRVGEALQRQYPELEIQYSFRASLGDLNQQDPLWKMPEKGVFTEDFLADLASDKADLVVHSWKDLPTQDRPHTEIAATLPRADIRDLLLFRRDRIEPVRSGAPLRVLTSSPRRAHNLDGFFRTYLPFAVNQISFEVVRGNIPTRLKKLLSQDVDALIVAKAALDRLLSAPETEFQETREVIRTVLAQTRFMVLPLNVNPTAAGQGALAIEILRSRDDLRNMLTPIDCSQTRAAVEAERMILAGHGGGCHQKIGISRLLRPFGQVTFLRGLTDRGEVLDRVEHAGTQTTPRPAHAREIFPAAGQDANFFTRVALPRESWSWAEQERFLWVARETAWPRDFRERDDAVVWTAGLRTWQKLAAKGVWVNGSAESLGEDEPARIEALSQDGVEVSWVKLTHAASASDRNVENLRPCATYRLEPRTESPNLEGKTHFFWMSGSSFDRALELYPRIRESEHACGPGLTYQHLRLRLGSAGRIAVYLSVEDWRRAVG